MLLFRKHGVSYHEREQCALLQTLLQGLIEFKNLVSRLSTRIYLANGHGPPGECQTVLSYMLHAIKPSS